MKRIDIFLKANGDLRDALLHLRTGDGIAWNGINELLRARGILARVRHETQARSDVLAQAPRPIPLALREKALDLGAYSLQSQFATKLYSTDCSAAVLCIQADVTNSVWKHRSEGFLFYPSPEAGLWPVRDKEWLSGEFESLGVLSADESMQHLRSVIERLHVHSRPVIVANMSSWIPGEQLSSYEGICDSLSERVKEFNLALIELSRQTGVAVLDVDRVIAGIGAEATKTDFAHYNAAGARAIAEALVNLLGELGLLD